MKSLTNSSLWIVFLLLVGNLFLNSCDKDKDDDQKASIPLLATSKSYNENGDLDYSESFQYDNQGRVIKMDDNEGYNATLAYTASTVTIQNYDDNEFSGTNTLQLNSKGLCTSISWDEEGEDIQTYEYDSNGFRKLSTEQDGSWVSTTAFTVSEGNYVRSISTEQSGTENSALTKVSFSKRTSLIADLKMKLSPQNRLKSATEESSSQTDYEFYKDKTNTIEYENMGVTFFGKQNKNAIKEEVRTATYNGEVYGPTTTSYTYEFDSKGRITKQTSNEGNYTVYTYVD